MTVEAKGNRLEWVEAGRGLAAIIVVCSHMPPLSSIKTLGSYGLGAMGVEFFFLLSGFIMLYVHWMDIQSPTALYRFAWRRAGRVFPTYWLVALFVLAINQLIVAPSHRIPLSLDYLVKQLFLLPGDLLIGPAWTLRHELLFYCVFGFMIVKRTVCFNINCALDAGYVACFLPPGTKYDSNGECTSNRVPPL